MATPNSSSSFSTSTPSANLMSGDGAAATAGASPLALLSDDILLNILARLEDDPRHWARLACVSPRLSALISSVCCRSRCTRSLPVDLLPSPSPCSDAVWPSLLKLSVCCPGLLLAGILLENSDFGLERDIGPNLSLPSSSSSSSVITTAATARLPPLPPAACDSADTCWSLFDDLYFDTIYDPSETLDPAFMQIDDPPAVTETPVPDSDESCNERREKELGSIEAHLASGPWTLSREQGNKLLASRFRSDCLYICDWPGCVHVEAKRKYMLFRGIFKNFKRSLVWRTIKDSKRGKFAQNCAFCPCQETWDLHSAFCLRRVFGFHDDGDPVVRAYVCENGHVSGAWTETPSNA